MIATARHTPVVSAAFAEILGRPQKSHGCQWDLVLRDTPIIAQHDAPWLVLTAPAPGDFGPLALLAWNGALPGWVKFALSASGELEIRAEIPIDEDAGPSIHEAWRGLETALALLGGGESQLPSGIAPAVSQAELKRLCDEAEWPCTPRDDGSCTVELEYPGSFMQASLAPRDCGVRVSVPLERFPESAAESVSALGILLLSAGSAMRMVRPACETADGKVSPRLEVVFSSVPAAAQLAHALSSLSVACQFCAEEVKALQDPNVAREFLALSKTKTRKEEP